MRSNGLRRNPRHRPAAGPAARPAEHPGGLAALSLDAMIHRSYARIGERLELGRIPGPVTRQRSLVVVPVTAITRLTRDALCAAVSLGDEVLAVTVVHTAPDTEDRQAAGVPPASGRGTPVAATGSCGAPASRSSRSPTPTAASAGPSRRSSTTSVRSAPTTASPSSSPRSNPPGCGNAPCRTSAAP
ncbi:hypothetical protein [Kitasatospora paranensis]|uniref:hypothetical protein n=1 Tax=Kitasatospora paranensis TaxID=258053 RepID=UPI003CD08158